MKLASFLFVFCVMMLFPTHADAFGKRGKGLFGRREPASCGTCASTASCATGSCDTNCANGQCSPATASFPAATQSTICINGKCYPVTSSGGPTPPSWAASPAWSVPAWQKK